jgi:hypothetical protein
VEITKGLFPADEVVTRGAYSLSFAGGGSVSLIEALDAAHGHKHAADGKEPTPEEEAAEHAGKAGKPVRIWPAHRVGMLEVGDPALVCAVSAAHRGQAFEVCSQLVDRIKARVPIWKEQFFADGTVEWVGAVQQLPSERPSQEIEK